MHADALADIDRLDIDATEHYTISLHRPEWHQGVVGVVASRLKDRYHRPAVVFARGGAGELRGSGRSIAGFHLRDALDLVAKRLPGAILRFGGHAFAAGLTLREEALAEFGAALEAVARERLTPADLRRVHESDGPLAIGELTFAFCRALGEPVWGQGLAPPAFDDVFDVVAQQAVGDGHARLALERSGERFGAIAFRTALPLPPRIHALYRPELRHFRDLLDLTLVVDYWTSA